MSSAPRADDEFRAKLSAEEYRVLRERGTERPFSGDLLTVKEPGTYACRACGNILFHSSAKFDSGTGWPSFDDVSHSEAVSVAPDERQGVTRVEVSCRRCGSHLGHVFADGPTKTGKRYCINSVCLDFSPGDE